MDWTASARQAHYGNIYVGDALLTRGQSESFDNYNTRSGYPTLSLSPLFFYQGRPRQGSATTRSQALLLQKYDS